MKSPVLFIAAAYGICLVAAIVFIAALTYDKNMKNRRGSQTEEGDWLLYRLYHKLFSAIFGDRNATEIAVKMGIPIEKYYVACKITETTPDPEKIVMHSIYAVLSLVSGLVVGLFTHPLFILMGMFGYIYYSVIETLKLKRTAEKMKAQIREDLPRFLDLLQTELQIGLPIESAIYLICSKMDSLLSKEFIRALHEMELGANDWQDAMENVALKYEIDTLSSFVLDVSIAYRKGVSVTESVTRQANEIRQKHLLNAKERAIKESNLLMIPIAVFQFVPMLAYLMIPAMLQALSVL